MISKLIVIICGLLLSTCLVVAGTTDPGTSDSNYVEFGKQFEHVGKIHGISIDDQNFYGSCVAINNNTVLTAAHIGNEIKKGYVDINYRTLKIIKVINHPLFVTKGKEYDIAICILDGDIEFDWFPKMYDRSDEVGKVCTLAGYGITGKFDSNDRRHDEKRRAGSNTIDGFEDNTLMCTASKSNKTALEFLTCYGDSGGGLFIGNDLAGIHSSISRIKSNNIMKNDYYTISYHVRISKHKDWINTNIKTLTGDK